MPLFLTSRGLESDEIEKAFLKLLPKKDSLDVYLITTASQEYKENNKNTQALRVRLFELGLVSNFIDIEHENPSILKKADVIIVCGGDPYYLLFHLVRSGADEIIIDKFKEDCLLFGISSGFLVFQKDIEIIDSITPEMNTIGLVNKKGLGLINEIIVPHFDRFVDSGIIKLAEIVSYENRTRKKIIPLGEQNGIIYFDGKIENVPSS